LLSGTANVKKMRRFLSPARAHCLFGSQTGFIRQAVSCNNLTSSNCVCAAALRILPNVESEAKIIVFCAYDSAIEANIAKTKLDAYGIPCFLTDEHMAALYPMLNFKGSKVRLHIFQEDEPRVREVLSEQPEDESFAA